jgi:hypothetical protein
MQKSTLPPVLQGGNVPSDTFSTLNLAVQSGMVTIDPYKRLGERWVSEACVQMLAWVKKHGEPITAMKREKDDQGNKIIENFQLLPDDLGDTTIQISVEFQAETPVNKPALLQGAKTLLELGVPTRVALEEAGETNARGLMEERKFEDLETFFFSQKLKEISDQQALMVQQQQMMMQQQASMMMQQQQQQQQGGPPQQGASMPPSMAGGGPPQQPGPEAEPSTLPETGLEGMGAPGVAGGGGPPPEEMMPGISGAEEGF